MTEQLSDIAYSKLMKCYDDIKGRIPFKPEIALVLGSGLNGYGDQMEIVSRIDYHDIDQFPISTVPGHKGCFLFGYIEGAPVVCMQGRVHYYEGYDISDVVLPTRLMRLMGAEILFLTNASGGVNMQFCAGDFMIINDHISDFVPSPLRGPNFDDLGPRFPDMSYVYDRQLIEMLHKSAKETDIPVREGVYLQFTGPNFETPAEIRMARMLGADAVGMSTVVEAMAANHMGMRICGISCISNMAAGVLDSPLSHEDVQNMANQRGAVFEQLITACIRNISRSTTA